MLLFKTCFVFICKLRFRKICSSCGNELRTDLAGLACSFGSYLCVRVRGLRVQAFTYSSLWLPTAL
jgi:hypothetical protein